MRKKTNITEDYTKFLTNGDFTLEYGSGDTKQLNATEKQVQSMIANLIIFEFMDADFYGNVLSGSDRDEYRDSVIKTFVKPALRNLDKFFKTYMEFKQSGYPANAWTLKKTIDTDKIIRRHIKKLSKDFYSKYVKYMGEGVNESVIKEELEPEDYIELREIIRAEIASIFFDLYKKKNVWTK